MKIKLGVMGSAGDMPPGTDKDTLWEKATRLAQAIGAHEVLLFTGATTGMVYAVGKTAHAAGMFHIGISPGANLREHEETYNLPADACDALIYTGFGLKGRNVILVRSCDIVLFIGGAMGSLNEFTIAHDEGKVIGCLTGSGGVADETDYLLKKFSKTTGARVFQNDDPAELVKNCLGALQ